MRWCVCGFFIALMLALGGSAFASKSQPFQFTLGGFEVESCVEQESPPASPVCSSPTGNVVNPTPCVWTVDQYINRQGYGDLASGAAASDHICLIADGVLRVGGEPHWIIVDVSATSPNLNITLSDSAGQSWTLISVAADNQTYTYSLCEPGPTFDSYPTIPDSNGGWGVKVDYTLTVANPGRTTHGVRAGWEIAGTALQNPDGTGPC